jgi:hypothetical protein
MRKSSRNSRKSWRIRSWYNLKSGSNYTAYITIPKHISRKAALVMRTTHDSNDRTTVKNNVYPRTKTPPPPLTRPILAASCLACIISNLLDLANSITNAPAANRALHRMNSK